MIQQSAITLSAVLREGEVELVRQKLEVIGADPAGNEWFPFGDFATLHFARFLVLEAAQDLNGRPLPPCLLFLANVDEPSTAFLRRLLKVSLPGIDHLFAHCVGYPSATGRTRDARLAFLESKLIPFGGYYVNTIGRSAVQIRREDQLRQALESFLDSRDWTGTPSEEVRKAIQSHVSATESLAWARSAEPPFPFSQRLAERLRFVFLACVGGLLGLVLSPLVLIWVLLIRMKERQDIPDDLRPDPEQLGRLRAREDLAAQNQFSAVGWLKPGWVRLTTARVVLALGHFSFRHVFNRGNLAGIPFLGFHGVDTIHFARWVFIDGGRRMLFASNYDGSLESYMGDFIDKVAWGLNLVFSNGQGWPRTRWLVQGGAEDETAFKDFLRRHQLMTDVWYSPYPHLTAVNIANNAAIRRGLSGALTKEEMQAWLRRF